MMTKIFKDKKGPLYNRQSRFMTVRPFTPAVLQNKAAAFLRATGEFKGYKISYKGLSMDDM